MPVLLTNPKNQEHLKFYNRSESEQMHFGCIVMYRSRTWEIPAACSQSVSYRRHGQYYVQVVSALVDKVLPHALFRWPRTHLYGLIAQLIQDRFLLIIWEQCWNHP